MLLVTFHGGSGGQNNVGAYADSGANIGTELSLAVLAVPDPNLLSELRGIGLVADGLLWVISGAKSASAILAFRGSGTSYAYTGAPVVEYGPVNSLWHPFDFTFDGNSSCYVSNQDTDVVARLAVAADLLSATTTPVAPALPPGTYLDATFVASSNGDLPGVPATTAVPSPAGLEVAFDCSASSVSVANSVRGVVWALGCLYVADEVANAVKVYGPTGEYLGQSKPIDSPVHLVLDGQILYTGSGDHVYAAALDPSSPAKLAFGKVKGISVKKVSGMAFGGNGAFYVASRKDKEIYKFPSVSSPSGATSWKVADEPEFLLHVSGS